MARGIANCTCKTCGATFEKIEFRQNRSAADSWAAWAESYYDECSTCWQARLKAEREEENRKAAEAAAEANLPALSGTEKQVAWANTIRQRVIDDLDKAAENCIEHMNYNKEAGREDRYTRWKESLDNNVLVRGYIISNYTKASWWIDNRDRGSESIARKAFDAAKKAAENVIQDDVAEETTVGPENQTHTGSVTISVSDTAIKATYQKEDDFRTLVKGLGYSWDRDSRAWQRTFSGWEVIDIPDRAAELGCILLNNGYAVTIQDAELRRKAVEADYAPEKTRKISHLVSGDYAGMLYVSWARNDDMYDATKKLPRARYSKPGIVVPVSEYAAVLDFADLYDFRLSPGALEAIQKEKDRIMPVAPAPAPVAEYNEKNVEDIMAQPADVLPDLVDQ